MIKLLDCTLRDGGYIVDFAFGENKTKAIIDNLILSNIDFIELGFLKNNKSFRQTSIFLNIDEASKYTQNYDLSKFFLMMKQGDFDLQNLPKAKEKDINLRYIFKKNAAKKAFSDCKKIIDKGYKLFINPVFIQEYEKEEYINLIKTISELKPKGISIVDSMGTFYKEELIEIYKNIDSFLDKSISICFHLHNNNERAFINAREIISFPTERQIVIDCSLAGMGRGAGNLCSELICEILNGDKNIYNISVLEDIIEEELNEFWLKNPWGNSYPYYLAGLYKVHSDYAGFLIKKGLNKTQEIENILKQIPSEKKANFDINLIKKLYKNST